MKLTESMHCYLDGARGIYIPRDFARSTKRECIKGVKPEDLDYLARGPRGCLDEDQTLVGDETVRGEFYWDTWQDILDNATVIDPESGIEYKLYQDDSLFLVPITWEWNDEQLTFEPPESDKLMRFELPSYWASYLINNDDSGISEEDKAQCDAFIERENLKDWTCADVSQNTWFAKSNDATSIASDCARYTFINEKE